MSKGKMIVVAGPTASGKTALGISLAQKYNGEIVSADSMQIYRGMDIGTAKATAYEQSLVKHHMIDVASPFESWSAAKYVEAADICCTDIISRGKIPVLVGGTGLYIDSLVSGRSFASAPDDPVLRSSLNDEFDSIGGDAMLEKLRSIDPERADKLHPSDRKRILRAIEVYMLTGRTITEHDYETSLLPPAYDAAEIILGFEDRAMLYDRINRRVDLMVRDGLFDEVSRLMASGLTAEHTAMQAIGYKEPAAALRGEISREEAVELIKLGSRRYAKRQLTWFGRAGSALRLNRSSEPDIVSDVGCCSEFLALRGII